MYSLGVSGSVNNQDAARLDRAAQETWDFYAGSLPKQKHNLHAVFMHMVRK